MSESQRTSKSKTAESTRRPAEGLKKWGEVAVERGFCTVEQVNAALVEQKRLQAQGNIEFLGAILVKQGIITKEQAASIERAMQGASQLGGFEILEKVGQGGMGAVFRARQVSMDRIVALKILPKRLAQDPKAKERFFREARLSATLNHLNLINGIDCGEAGGYTFFAMEFVEGDTGRKLLKNTPRLPVAEAEPIIHQIALALEYAHSKKLIHRDVKPENIMITKDGTAKLCDLGLSRTTNDTDAMLTQAGQIVGTPYYISPEQAKGAEVDGRTDIYSLGATFYHFVSGRPPFDGPSAAVIMAKHITETAPPLSGLVPELPDDYAWIICKMMAKSADDRYATMEEVLDDLKAVKQGRSPKATSFRAPSSCPRPIGGARRAATTGPASPITSSSERIVRQRPRGEKNADSAPMGLILGGVGAVVLLVIVVLGSGSSSSPPPKPKPVPPPVARNDPPPAPPIVAPQPVVPKPAPVVTRPTPRPPDPVSPQLPVVATLGDATFWHSWNMAITEDARPAKLKDEAGGNTATLGFFCVEGPGQLDEGVPLNSFSASAHSRAGNRADNFWCLEGQEYPYIGKSTVERGSDEGETNAPQPHGVRDLQMQPPVKEEMVVAVFTVPAAGYYSVQNLAMRLREATNSTGSTRFRVYDSRKSQLVELKARHDRAWVTDSNQYPLGQLAPGSKIYFAVDRGGRNENDATEVIFTVAGARDELALRQQTQRVTPAVTETQPPVKPETAVQASPLPPADTKVQIARIKFLSAMRNSAMKGGDLQKTLKEIQGIAGKPEYQAAKDYQALDLQDLERVVKFEQNAMEALVKLKAEVKVPEGHALRKMMSDKSDSVKVTSYEPSRGLMGSFGQGETSLKGPTALPAKGIVEAAKLENREGEAAFYYMLRGAIADAEALMPKVPDDERPRMQGRLDLMRVGEAELLAQESYETIAKLVKEEQWKAVLAAITTFEKDHSATKLATDKAPELSAWKMTADEQVNPMISLFKARDKKLLPDGWVELTYDFTTPEQAKDFTAENGQVICKDNALITPSGGEDFIRFNPRIAEFQKLEATVKPLATMVHRFGIVFMKPGSKVIADGAKCVFRPGNQRMNLEGWDPGNPQRYMVSNNRPDVRDKVTITVTAQQNQDLFWNVMGEQLPPTRLANPNGCIALLGKDGNFAWQSFKITFKPDKTWVTEVRAAGNK